MAGVPFLAPLALVFLVTMSQALWDASNHPGDGAAVVLSVVCAFAAVIIGLGVLNDLLPWRDSVRNK